MVCTLFYQEDLIHNTLKLFSHVFSTALHVCTTVSMGHSSSGAILLKVSVLCSHLSCGRGTRYSCLGGRSYHLFVFGVFCFVEEGNMLLFSSMHTLYISISRDHLTWLGPSSLCTAVFTTCKQGDMQVFKRGSQRLKRKTEMIAQTPGRARQVHTA